MRPPSPKLACGLATSCCLGKTLQPLSPQPGALSGRGSPPHQAWESPSTSWYFRHLLQVITQGLGHKLLTTGPREHPAWRCCPKPPPPGLAHPLEAAPPSLLASLGFLAFFFWSFFFVFSGASPAAYGGS